MENYKLLTKLALLATSRQEQDAIVNSIITVVGTSLNLDMIGLYELDEATAGAKLVASWGGNGNQEEVIGADLPEAMIHLLKNDKIVDTLVFTELDPLFQATLNPNQGGATVVVAIKEAKELWGFGVFAAKRELPIFAGDELEMMKFSMRLIENLRDYSYFEQATLGNCRNIFDQLNQLIVIWDDSGAIIYVNEYFIEQTGYVWPELRKMKITDLAPTLGRNHDFGNRVPLDNDGEFKLAFDLYSKDEIKVALEGQVLELLWQTERYAVGIFKNITAQQEELHKFIALFRNNPALICLVALPSLKLVDVNISFEEKTGYQLQELKGRPLYEIELFTQSPQYTHVLEKIIKNREAKDIELEVHCKDGRILDGLFSAEMIANQGGEYILMVLVDITKQKQIQQLYGDERKRLNSIIEGTRLGTWEWNVQTGEIVINDLWAKMLGYRLEELAPISVATWTNLLHPDDLNLSTQLLERHFKGEIEFYDIECRMRHKNGTWFWVHDRGKVIEWDKNGQPSMMYGTHSDINKKKEVERKINELSIRDPLTDIYNRRYIYEQLDKDLHRYRRNNMLCSVGIIDIDKFKEINDSFGHLAGDFILKEFTKLISDHLREYDLLGRYGGEEFILVMYDSDRSDAAMIIERILELTRDKTFEYQGHQIRFTFSAGIADITEFELSELSNEKIISLADSRLYCAKQKGRNRIIIE